jgi:hypothetical protein
MVAGASRRGRFYFLTKPAPTSWKLDLGGFVKK